MVEWKWKWVLSHGSKYGEWWSSKVEESGLWKEEKPFIYSIFKYKIVCEYFFLGLKALYFKVLDAGYLRDYEHRMLKIQPV